jgi:hypothetical protein
MANFLDHVTLVSPNVETARSVWARLGFALPPGGAIALGSCAIVLRDAAERPPALAPLSFAMIERPNENKSPPSPHPNGAQSLAALAQTFENPADHAESLGRVAGQREMRATSAGLELKLENARWEVLTPTAFAQRYGGTQAQGERNAEQPQALVFAVSDLDATRAYFEQGGIAFEERSGRLVLTERPAGLILAFEA